MSMGHPICDPKFSGHQFGQQCCGKNEEEDIQKSTIEKTGRGNLNCDTHESNVDLTPIQ